MDTKTSWDNCSVAESTSSSLDSRQASLPSDMVVVDGTERPTKPTVVDNDSDAPAMDSAVCNESMETQVRSESHEDVVCDPSMETVSRVVTNTRISLKVRATSKETKLFPSCSIQKAIGESVKFGRQAYCDVRINSEFCSREHFQICFNGTEFQLFNLSQKLPTCVNGNAVMDPIALAVGDKIQVDEMQFTLYRMEIRPTDTHFAVSLRKPSRRSQDVNFRVHLKLTNAYLPATPPINILPFSKIQNPCYPSGNYAFGGSLGLGDDECETSPGDNCLTSSSSEGEVVRD